jgi:hypothetical protein
MPSYAVLGVVAAYAVIAVLLLSLNIASLWRWPIKAGAIVVTSGLFVGTYMAIEGMIGWPSSDHLPARASFLASRIVEPDKFTGDPGVIFVWLQSIDEQDLPVGEPRAYKIAYNKSVAKQVVEAQRLRGQGRDVVGTFDYSAEKPAEQPAPGGIPVVGQDPASLRDVETRPGGAGGMFSMNQDLHAVFVEMPPLPLPDKVPIQGNGYDSDY